MLLLTAVSVCVFAVAYFIFVRPVLRARPSLAEFWQEEDRFLEALRLKVAGLKAWLTTMLVIVAGVALELNDFIAPLAAQAGIDVHTLLPQIPASAWPFITIGLMLLLQYFRKIAGRRERAGGEPV